jgi:hypothetical protein
MKLPMFSVQSYVHDDQSNECYLMALSHCPAISACNLLSFVDTFTTGQAAFEARVNEDGRIFKVKSVSLVQLRCLSM